MKTKIMYYTFQFWCCSVFEQISDLTACELLSKVYNCQHISSKPSTVNIERIQFQSFGKPSSFNRKALSQGALTQMQQDMKMILNF